MAYLLERDYGFELPRLLQVEVARAVQVLADETGKELTSEQIYGVFNKTFVEPSDKVRYVKHSIEHQDGVETISATIVVNGEEKVIQGQGNGPLSAFASALNQTLGTKFSVTQYSQHDIHPEIGNTSQEAVCYVQVAHPDQAPTYGVGLHSNIVTASFLAFVAAMNRNGALV